MEIQVDAAHLRKKALLLGLLVVTLLTASLAITQQQQPVTPPVAPATPAPAGAQGITLTFLDGSAQWDWQPNACATPLQTFVVNAPVVRIILVDDSAGWPLRVVYPDLQATNAATAAAKCTHSAADLRCQVGVRAGQGADLDVAVAAALAYALQEDARPKTKEAYDARPAWAWANFQPVLVKKEGSQWQSCLSLSPAK